MLQKIKNIFHLLQAIIANIIYGFPSQKLKVIGITGTDGKTTTTHLIYHILKTGGKKASMISTVYGKIGDKEYNTGLHTTTPDPFLINKLIKEAVLHKDEYFVLETTSHALDQFRVYGITYEVGVLTNITHEHLDYHKTYENYVKAKMRLLENSKIALINSDDRSYNYISKHYISKRKIYTYGFKHKSNFKCNFLTHITGFNRYNYLAGYGVASLLHISDDIIEKAFRTFTLPPGRLEVVYKNKFTVIIDFAHTPNAFAQVLPVIHKKYIKGEGKLIHVFGAASQRDSSKRSIMGKESAKFADHIILTEEDCRNEDPIKICREIAQEIKDSNKYEIIPNRKEAIQKAIELAKPNDVIVLTGKSHEKSLCRGSKEYPWDEFEVVNQSLQKKFSI